jgi:hypothetical protein
MANEITTSTIDDFSYAAIISPILIATLAEKAAFLAWAREFNIVGQPSSAYKLGSITSYWGSPNDRGAGVDTEFNATEGTELSNTAVSSGSVTISTAEFGVAHELTDTTSEDVIDSLDLLNLLRGTMMSVMQLAMADDMCAQFANLSNSIGTSGSDFTVAQLLAGKNDIRTRGGFAPDGVGYVLDTQAFADIENAFVATSTSAAVYALAADRILDFQPAPNNGMTDGRVASFRGDPAYATGLTDTANAGADVVSAVFVPSTAANDDAALTTYGQVWKRLPRFETERHAKKRTTDLVMTLRWGIGELLDGTGSKYVTDAP